MTTDQQDRAPSGAGRDELVFPPGYFEMQGIISTSIYETSHARRIREYREARDNPETAAIAENAYEVGYREGESSATADWQAIAEEYGIDELIRRVKERIDWTDDQS